MEQDEASKNLVDSKQEFDAFPTKSFFVHMITRDIELEDAILDLIDNCIDGVLRSIDTTGESERPYEKYWANIHISETEFKIADNCGGIPIEIAKEYAFRFGRPEDVPDLGIHSIGMYGIGMKRALFKMGCNISVTSQHAGEAFNVSIDSDWMYDDSKWKLPFENIPLIPDDGTVIEVRDLYDNIKTRFSSSAFVNEFRNFVSQHYSIIINKGFRVIVNDIAIEPKTLYLKFADLEDEQGNRITPYLWEAVFDGVEVKLAVGFYRELPSEEELEEAEEGKEGKRKTEYAGWNIVCNDRVVLYCDKSQKTGWGDHGVPKYHTQFISIAGIVILKSEHPDELPLITTKRGMDPTSDLYAKVKLIMIDGMKLFIDYTNKWKGRLDQEKRISSNVETVELANVADMIKKVPEEAWRPTTRIVPDAIGKRYVPKLPLPVSARRNRFVRFTRPIEEIKVVSEYLFEDENRPASIVGNECFQKILDEATK